MQADLLIRDANVATLKGLPGARAAIEASDVALVEHASVAVAKGRIVWVGPMAEWGGRAARTVAARGRLLTPGYVDPHTHLVYGGDRAFELALKLAGRSYLEILAAGGGIMHTVRETRSASTAALVRQAQARLARMVRAGTTAIESKSGYGLETATELRMLEASRQVARKASIEAAHTFLGAHAVPSEYKGRTADYVDVVVDEMMPKVASQGIASFVDAFVEKDVFTVEHGERIFAAARKHKLATRLHADEIVNTAGAELAARAGCVSADHLLRVSESGIQAMAEAKTTAILMPSVPITLMRPEWPLARALMGAGIPVALATDHNPNNPVTDLQLVAQLGCHLLALTPEQALTAVTWNAACTLGLHGKVGSIEEGKRADLVLHEVSTVAQWVYHLGRNTAGTVWVGGKVVR